MALVVGIGVLLHFIGDYVTQSHYMATEKTVKWFPAILHGVVYGFPFLLITQSPWALLVIIGTHILIDHYRWAKQLSWLKNQVGPKRTRPSFAEAMANNGYNAATPVWMSTWLMIILDNTLHIGINTAALVFLG